MNQDIMFCRRRPQARQHPLPPRHHRPAYDESVLTSDDQKTLARKTRRLTAQAAALGYTLVPVEASS